MADQIEIGNVSASEVYAKLQESGISQVEAGLLVGQWIVDTFGKGKKVFKYAPPVPEVDAACTSTFAREFAHADWVDGESVVQAETTPGEEGFNARFHKIEADIDALGAETAKSLACISSLRKAVHDALEQVRVAINQLNEDVYACCGGGITTKPGTLPSSVSDLWGQLALQHAGEFELHGQPMVLYSTQKGLVALPKLATVTAHPQIGQRVVAAGKLAALFATHPEIAAQFGTGAVTKSALVQRFGGELAADGRSLVELVAMLPKAASFTSLSALVSAVADLEGAAMRSSPAEASALKTSLGLQSDQAAVADAGVSTLVFLSKTVKTALLEAGITTVRALANAEGDRLLRVLRAAGVDVASAQVVEWGATARTLMGLDG